MVRKIKRNNMTVFNKYRIFNLLLICGLFMFSQCSNAIFEKSYELEDESWAKDSSYVFEFEVNNTSQEYLINYQIRNNLEYPFHNLYLQYNLEDSEGKILRSEIQEVQLMEKKTGRPYGKGFSDLYQNTFVATSYSFPASGKYKFRVNHYMREQNVTGLVSFGVEVVPALKVE